MLYLDVTNDYYLRKGMELERQREKVLDAYTRSRNPKALQKVQELTAECHAIWTTVRLKEFNKIGMREWLSKQREE
jgi:predicted GIY-YIG superfamily endonuclease